jgi:uncharacterized membrane protein YbhN (UPF0104 family)
MKRRGNRILWLIAVVFLAALVWFGARHFHFNWTVFLHQLRLADWRRMALALGCIYAGYLIRGYRWVRLMWHKQKLPPLSLVGTQVMGFTAVALIGRVADLSRPYLVSKKTGQPLTAQFAVYVVERLFDAGAMAVAGALFLLAVRLAGGKIASLLGAAFGAVSRKAGRAVESKIHSFRSGLDTIRNFSDFAIVSSLSLVMWVLIALAYLFTLRAFVASPPLAAMAPARAVLLMVFSGGVSALQLPVLGWFTQIGFVAAAIASFFGASPEASLGCAAALLLVTFLGIVPVGLVWARFDRVSLIKVAEESEHAGEELVHHAPKEPARQI